MPRPKGPHALTRSLRACGLALALAALLAASPANADARAGDLYRGFGSNGRVTTPFPDGVLKFRDVVRQPDGRLVAIGQTTSFDGALVRYMPDGPSTPEEVFIETRLVGARGQAAPPQGNVVRFEDALGGEGLLGELDPLTAVDLSYTADDDVLTEELTFGNLALTTPTVFTFNIDHSPALRPVPGSDGAIDFLDASGEPRLALHPAVMADDSRTAGGFSRAASWSVTPTSPGTATATLAADRSWTASPARTKPVKLRYKVGRKGGKGSWNPGTQVLAYGVNVWGEGKCCGDNPDQHPEQRDFARMGVDGLEYVRTALFPCAGYGLYDTFIEETARKKVQVLPSIQGGTRGCDGGTTHVTAGHNAPDEGPEYKDMHDTGAELASGPLRARGVLLASARMHL